MVACAGVVECVQAYTKVCQWYHVTRHTHRDKVNRWLMTLTTKEESYIIVLGTVISVLPLSTTFLRILINKSSIIIAKSENLLNFERIYNCASFFLFFWLQFRMVSTLSSSIEIPFVDIINAKYLTVSLWNSHFPGFKYNPAASSCCIIHLTWPTCSSSESLYIKISSK